MYLYIISYIIYINIFHITGFHTPVSKHVRTFSLQSHQVLVFKAVVLRGNFKIISPGVHTIYHGKCRSPFGHFPDSRGVLPRKILGKIHIFLHQVAVTAKTVSSSHKLEPLLVMSFSGEKNDVSGTLVAAV